VTTAWEESTSPPIELVALGSSAGGLRALRTLLHALPGDFGAPILIVQHLAPRHRSLMAEILARDTPMQVRQAEDGIRVTAGTVYIAIPDRHLLVDDDGTLRLSDSELVRFVRPSVDVLFQSVASSYGERAVGVVLTGTGSDGAMGVEALHAAGGTVIVEDTDTAEFDGMPSAARATGAADFELPLAEIPRALLHLVPSAGADA
jgi:two-component system chemotaxis response regulator CheB